MKCKAPISPCLCLQKKIPSISDIRKNFLLSSALGRKQTCSKTQPAKGSLKHCGQGPRATHGPSGGLPTGQGHCHPLSTHADHLHMHKVSQHRPRSGCFTGTALGQAGATSTGVAAAGQEQGAEPRETLSPLAAPAHQPSATQCSPFHSIPVSQSPRES